MAKAWTTVARYLGANVRLLREAAGLTQEELGEAAHLDPKHVQGIELGRARHQNVKLKTLVDLANALEVSPGRLLEPATSPRPRSPGRPPRLPGASRTG